MKIIPSKELKKVTKKVYITTGKRHFYPVAHKSKEDMVRYHSGGLDDTLMFETEVVLYEPREEDKLFNNE